MVKIASMKVSDIPDVINLWKAQFNNYYCDAFPNFTNGGQPIIESYIRKQIDSGNSIIATKDSSIVGYMAWMDFDFHNERTAFLPIVGHATSRTDEFGIYQEMYYFVSQKWVSDDRFNHLWMTYFNDDILKNGLYDLGFGSYVIDACQSTSKTIQRPETEYKIAFASSNDVDVLLEFANTSTTYYAAAPIFLKRAEHTKEEIAKLIDDGCALLAWDNEKVIGFMSLTIRQDFHFEHLTTPDCLSVGAFIHQDYRGKGIGTAFLEKALDICRKKGKPYIHVSFESANPNAIKFWPKYFKPAIRSVRRTINKDANTAVGH